MSAAAAPTAARRRHWASWPARVSLELPRTWEVRDEGDSVLVLGRPGGRLPLLRVELGAALTGDAADALPPLRDRLGEDAQEAEATVDGWPAVTVAGTTATTRERHTLVALGPLLWSFSAAWAPTDTTSDEELTAAVGGARLLLAELTDGTGALTASSTTVSRARANLLAPPTWTVSPLEAGARLFGPPDARFDDHRPTLSVVLHEDRGGTDLEGAAQALRREVLAAGGSPTAESRWSSSSCAEAYACRHLRSDPALPAPVVQLSALVLRDDGLWVLQGVTLAPSADTWEPVLERALASLRLLPPVPAQPVPG